MNSKMPSYIRIVVLLTLVNLAIQVIRNWYVGDTFFNFLKSNLFIGSIPTLFFAWLIDRYHMKMGNLIFWILVGLWVLFYPNAPYMISDLIHSAQDPQNAVHPDLVKFDTLIIFSFAMLSVFIGFLSLKIMFRVFTIRYSLRFAKIAIAVTLVLSCIGFYMGRELISAIKIGNGYLYSWEIFLEPGQILKILSNALFPINEHIPAYLMMILFGVIQLMLLIMFKNVSDVEGVEVVKVEEKISIDQGVL